ncbi:MAG: IS200/IS605 family element RNA-guided endonuclease TnpB [Ktedonobacteraceae bacterium]
MIKAHKIRLHATPEHAIYFAKAAGTARFCFNWAVAERQRQYKAGGKPSALKLRTQFHGQRKEQLPWTYEVTKSVVEGAFMDVAAAFKNFFQGRKADRAIGYPKFKSKKRSHQSFYLANDRFTVGDHWIMVPKLGRVNMAESLRLSGKILSARISKTASWWFVSINVEVPNEVPLNTHPPVGVDVGLNRLATLSDGGQYENQRPLIHQLKKLRRLNKELARRTKGGKNWLKTKDKLGRLHYEIACIRLDWLHKLTTEIATTSGIVAVEDLHVRGLMHNRCLSRSFSDAAVGKLLNLLESKVQQQGRMLIKVDRFFPSSQLCHWCGARKTDLTLADRVFNCPDPACGYIGDRDENASCNIIVEALRMFGLNLNMPSGVVATTRRKTAWGPGVRPK